MEAYVTLVATDSYAPGALVLSHRLRDLGSQKEIVCLVTPDVSNQVQDKLREICTVIPVDTLRSTNHDNLQVLGRTELDITFTKIQLWKLTQYKKVVFLDADTYPLQNIDDLFGRPSFSAAPDSGWPDCFNSGVFVTEPSEAVYDGLMDLAKGKGSFDGGDQGLLNTYFNSWSNSPSKRLPFTYNTTPTTQYGYAPAHNEFSHSISVFHFIGKDKPWTYQRFTDGKVLPRGNTWQSVSDMVQKWWDTWDSHYGRVAPFHLLEGLDSSFDTGFQTRPIVPFDESIENAWNNQDVDLDDKRRHVREMPPVSISLRQPTWVQDDSPYDPYYHDHQHERNNHDHHDDNNHHQDEHHHQEERHEEHHQENHHHEEHHEENNHQEHHQEHHQERHQEHHHQEEHHQEHHHQEEHHQEHHNQEEHHQEKPKKEEKVYSMLYWDPSWQEPPTTGKLDVEIPAYGGNAWDNPVKDQPVWVAPVHHPEPDVMSRPEYSHYDTKEYENSQRLYNETYSLPHEHRHEDTYQQPETYNEPQYHQHQEHHHEHHHEHHQEYHQEYHHEQHQEHHHEQHQQHHHEHHQEHHHEQHHHEQHQEYHQEHHHEQHQEYHQEHHQEHHYNEQYNENSHNQHHEQQQQQKEPEPEVVYPPAFPWESNPSHFPPPSRIWLDEISQQQQQQQQQKQEEQQEEQKEEQQQQLEEQKEEPYIPYVPEEPKAEVYYPPVFPWENKPDHFPKPTRVWQDEQPPKSVSQPKRAPQSIPVSPPKHVPQAIPVPQLKHSSPPRAVSPPNREEESVVKNEEPLLQHAMTTDKKEEIESMMSNNVPEPLGMETPITEIENPFATSDEFAIDRTTSPFEQQKILEFVASLADDDGDVSVRDLIPINFKPTSKLNNGMYTPTNGSPSASRTTSRRGSVVSISSKKESVSSGSSRSVSPGSSRRGSVISPKKKKTLVQAQSVPSPLDIVKSTKSSKLFATGSSSSTGSTNFKTPYTSAAASPLQSPDIEKSSYFGFGQPAPVFKKIIPAPSKRDFLKKSYSLDESIATEKVSKKSKVVEWDPYKALDNLKAQSENMVIKKSLEEALRTSTVDGSFKEFIDQPQQKRKKKSVMSYSSVKPNEKEIDNKISKKGNTSVIPSTFQINTNTARHMEAEKERYKQQYNALSLTKTQAALASTLEAEVELSQGSLLKREFYENETTELPVYDDVELLAGDDVPIDESFVAYFDPYVIQESKKKLTTLLKDEDIPDESPMPISRAQPVANKPFQVSVNEMRLEPQPFSLLFDKDRYLPNFGFKNSKKFDIFSDDNNEEEDSVEDLDPVLSYKLLSAEMLIPNVPQKKKNMKKHIKNDNKKETPIEAKTPTLSDGSSKLDNSKGKGKEGFKKHIVPLKDNQTDKKQGSVSSTFSSKPTDVGMLNAGSSRKNEAKKEEKEEKRAQESQKMKESPSQPTSKKPDSQVSKDAGTKSKMTEKVVSSKPKNKGILRTPSPKQAEPKSPSATKSILKDNFSEQSQDISSKFSPKVENEDIATSGSKQSEVQPLKKDTKSHLLVKQDNSTDSRQPAPSKLTSKVKSKGVENPASPKQLEAQSTKDIEPNSVTEQEKTDTSKHSVASKLHPKLYNKEPSNVLNPTPSATSSSEEAKLKSVKSGNVKQAATTKSSPKILKKEQEEKMKPNSSQSEIKSLKLEDLKAENKQEKSHNDSLAITKNISSNSEENKVELVTVKPKQSKSMLPQEDKSKSVSKEKINEGVSKSLAKSIQKETAKPMPANPIVVQPIASPQTNKNKLDEKPVLQTGLECTPSTSTNPKTLKKKRARDRKRAAAAAAAAAAASCSIDNSKEISNPENTSPLEAKVSTVKEIKDSGNLKSTISTNVKENAESSNVSVEKELTDGVRGDMPTKSNDEKDKKQPQDTNSNIPTSSTPSTSSKKTKKNRRHRKK